jgi:hypothetical protein
VARLFSEVAPDLGRRGGGGAARSNGNIAGGSLPRRLPYVLPAVLPDTLITVNPGCASILSDPLKLVPSPPCHPTGLCLVNPSLVKTRNSSSTQRRIRACHRVGSHHHHHGNESAPNRSCPKFGTPAAVTTTAAAAVFSGSVRAHDLDSAHCHSEQDAICILSRPAIDCRFIPVRCHYQLALFAPAAQNNRGPPACRVSKFSPSDVKTNIAAGGLELFVTTRDEFAELIRSDYAKYAKLVKSLGIVVQ